jgi:glycosyltransferase involved in cell wall biosynthesis
MVAVAETGCAPEVISYGIDPAFFQSETLSPEKDSMLRAKLGIPTQVPILLHVGRLDIDKLVDILIRAAADAMQDHPAHLLIVGDGTEKNRLVKLCHEMGIGPRSHFPGFITVQGGLPDLYRLAYVFITASEIETQGLVLQEAQACGLPMPFTRRLAYA